MTSAIKIEDLSKRYIIGHQRQERYTTLRDVLMHNFRGIGQRFMHPLSPNREKIMEEELWALRDINLEIQKGERLGVIGGNGAGKSTLLKVLSRITAPTKGRFTMNGRVASLLEVGTGFHPELTGRENIFLNGAILGMGKKEIKRKFDEIVDFAETERFLDTPVKRYSSGMYVRLAFAVAAHLEPEILIVDEVLAVGDGQFQKKCLGKMEQVGKEGRTVLFVSHNMTAIQSLCTSAIHLNQGKIVGQGTVAKQIKSYLFMQQAQRVIGSESRVVIGNKFRIERLEFFPNPIEKHEHIEFLLELSADCRVRVDSIVVLFFTNLNQRVGIIDLRKSEPYRLDSHKPLVIKGLIEPLSLVEGEYSVGLYFSYEGCQETVNNVLTLSLLQDEENESDVTPYSESVRGFVEFKSRFEILK